MIMFVEPGHVLRAPVEKLIGDIYSQRYNAQVERFPMRLLCSVDREGALTCAAGLRTSADGFFSEQYLDMSVEQALEHVTQQSIQRNKIFEVTSLVSRSPRFTLRFIRNIVRYGFQADFLWCFFTATSQLVCLLELIGLSPFFVAPAEERRVKEPLNWGDYYRSNPRVVAISRSTASTLVDFPAR